MTRAAWNKGKKLSVEHRKNLSLSHKGQHSNPEGEFKIKDSRITGENHWNWKGDEVGYHALHGWIARELGTPSFCEECKSENAVGYEWANISGEYKRDLTDWKRLCIPCHREFDKIVEKIVFKKRINKALREGKIKVICLAAGYGKRLGNLTKDTPKPLLLINGKPIIEHILISLEKFNIKKYIVNLHYLPNLISNYLGDRALYFYEPRLLGHVGTIKALKNWLENDDIFIVINCDTITNCDYLDMVKNYKKGTILALMDENRCAGVWIYPSEYLENPDLPIIPYRPNGLIWHDISTPERLEEAKKYFEGEK